MSDHIIPLAVLERVMLERGVGAARIERVVRLNPNGVPEGSIPRGMGQPARLNWMPWQIGKGAFIRVHGRKAWDDLPAIAKGRQGRRAWVSLEAVEDRAWLFPADHPVRKQIPFGKGNRRIVVANDSPAR